MSVIEELYYGNIMGSAFTNSKEWLATCKPLYAEYEKFLSMLNAEQKKQFDKWLDMQIDQHALEKMEAYKYAMAVGIGLGYESKEITKCKE